MNNSQRDKDLDDQGRAAVILIWALPIVSAVVLTLAVYGTWCLWKGCP